MAGIFGDGKSDGAMRTIGEVGLALGLKAHVLRYWEQQFPMLQPLKRSGGRRYYRSEDVALLQRIDRMVNHEGYTIRGARAVLERSVPSAARPEAGEPFDGQATAQSHSSVKASAENVDELDRAALLTRLHAIRAKLVEALG